MRERNQHVGSSTYGQLLQALLCAHSIPCLYPAFPSDLGLSAWTHSFCPNKLVGRKLSKGSRSTTNTYFRGPHKPLRRIRSIFNNNGLFCLRLEHTPTCCFKQHGRNLKFVCTTDIRDRAALLEVSRVRLAVIRYYWPQLTTAKLAYDIFSENEHTTLKRPYFHLFASGIQKTQSMSA